MINLIYLSGNTTGGWITFTYHLLISLQNMGEINVNLYKIGNRTEPFARPFGYDLHYQNITLDAALGLEGQTIIVAAAKNYREAAAALIANGAKLVLHDPTELRAGLAGIYIDKPWVIRKAVHAQVPGSVFIRHPYVRHERPTKLPKRSGVISTSRIDFDKNTALILEANRLGANIKIHGFENRLYTKFKIVPFYPEWEQSKVAYPRTPDAAFDMLLGANAMVDLSDIKGDGGGTQYTFLEAWDAGCVPIIGKWWVRKGDDMVDQGRLQNCWSIEDSEDLYKLARRVGALKEVREAIALQGERVLKRHAPKVIVPQVMEWLNAR